ncbi:MAG TPA: PDZ domain-containing protein, partial [Solirubrobacterales bacterium]|nr:PDZ domain-containing protein [Solirubrobacterales bacterium]
MRLLLAVLAVAAALAAGIYIGANPGTPVIGDLVELVTGDDAAVDTDVARDLIKNDFYKPVPDSTLRDGSIDGMVKALKDPYTQYLSPAHNKLFQQAISGKYSGVGMGVDDDKRGLLVTFTYPGSPARKAGVKPGDVITKVNGKSIVGVPSEAAVARIKGPENTEVTLTIRSPRGGGQRLGPEHDLRLKRKQIEIPV